MSIGRLLHGPAGSDLGDVPDRDANPDVKRSPENGRVPVNGSNSAGSRSGSPHSTSDRDGVLARGGPRGNGVPPGGSDLGEVPDDGDGVSLSGGGAGTDTATTSCSVIDGGGGTTHARYGANDGLTTTSSNPQPAGTACVSTPALASGLAEANRS